MEGPKNITLTYLNIRQSISILIFKLIFIDLFFAGLVIGVNFLMSSNLPFLEPPSSNPAPFLFIFITLGIVKLLLGAYTILLWLNEYYEITPDFISHRTGIINRSSEKYKLENLRKIIVNDSLMGEVFNFGTVSLYDIRLNKYLDMYLIHNPNRYARIFKTLIPDIEVKENKVWLPFLKGARESSEDLVE